MRGILDGKANNIIRLEGRIEPESVELSGVYVQVDRLSDFTMISNIF